MDKAIDIKVIRRRRRIMALRIGIALIAIAVMSVVALMLSGSSVKRSDLRFGKADSGILEASISASGKVVPSFEQIIVSPIESRIMEVYARVGDTLRCGTPLLLLDLEDEERELQSMRDRRSIRRLEMDKESVGMSTQISDVEMQVKVKEMTVDRLEADLENERRLDSIGSGTGEKIRQAELALKTARLELSQLRKLLAGTRASADASGDVNTLNLSVLDAEIASKMSTLSDARLLSPREATLTYIDQEIGKRVAPGEKLAVIADLRHFKINGQVSDSYVDRLTIGQRVKVVAGQTRIEGTITNIEPNSAGGVVSFSVALDDEDNPRLRPGLTTDLYIQIDVRDNTVRIPRGPYYTGPGLTDMWVMDAGGDRILRRKVRLGDANPDYVEVIDGIVVGETVVTNVFESSSTTSVLKLK